MKEVIDKTSKNIEKYFILWYNLENEERLWQKRVIFSNL